MNGTDEKDYFKQILAEDTGQTLKSYQTRQAWQPMLKFINYFDNQ